MLQLINKKKIYFIIWMIKLLVNRNRYSSIKFKPINKAVNSNKDDIRRRLLKENLAVNCDKWRVCIEKNEYRDNSNTSIKVKSSAKK